MIRKFLAYASFAAFLALFLAHSSAKNNTYRHSFFSLGTSVEIAIPLSGIEMTAAKRAAEESAARLSEINDAFSIFDTNSELSAINNNPLKKECKVSTELYFLIKRCMEYYTLSGGTFDITVKPLVEAWGFGSEKKRTACPKARDIEELLKYVGMDKITLDDTAETVYFDDPRIQIDLGAVVPGYAADEIVKILKLHGIRSAIINIGGEIYCLGNSSGGRKWRVGIRHPDNKNKIIAALDVANKAISTSGNYENFYIYGGEECGHIIDPRTGYISRNNLISVTIIADDCATADALATAVFVLGEEKGIELINKLSGIEAFLVVRDGNGTRLRMSNGMSELCCVKSVL